MATTERGYTRRVAIAVAVAAFATIIVLIVWAAARMLLLVFGGVLLAILLRALGELLARYTHLRESWCVWIVIVALACVFGFGGWYLSSELVGQFDALAKSAASAWDAVRRYLEATALGRYFIAQLGNAETSGSFDQVARVIAVIGSGVSGLVISIFIGLYVAADPTLYRKGLLHLVPRRSRERAQDILDDLHDRLRSWLVGTFVLMIVIGVLTFIGLAALGIPLALSLAVIAFLFEFIPYVGPILSAVPAVLVASTVGVQDVLFVILLYWGIQSLEGYVLAPIIFQRRVSIPPMLSLGAQVLMGTLFGILGIVFATPLTACCMVLVQRLYVEGVLGDRVES